MRPDGSDSPVSNGGRGLKLSKDDAFWQTHFPPNGWGCNCSVRGLWARDLKRLGKDAPDSTPEVQWLEREIGKNSANGPRLVRVPEGIDPGFEYAPGKARLQSAVPPERPEPLVPGSAGGHGLPNRRPLKPLPPPRPMSPEQLLPVGLAPEEYVRAFLAPLGGGLDRSTIVPDVIGERLVVGKELFQTAKGEWKVLKLGRERFLPLLAQALLQPDEIWARMEWMYALNKAVVRRRYVARFSVEGQDIPALVVFEYGAGGWSGITAFQGATQTADDWRVGVRLYARE